MDVVVRSRNTSINDRFRANARDKLDRLARLDSKADRVDVEVSAERNRRQSAERIHVELTYHARGPALRACGAASDPFAALDLAVNKLHEQIRRAADRRRVHHGTRTPASIQAVLNGDRAIMGEENLE